jgi:hypothetical protein
MSFVVSYTEEVYKTYTTAKHRLGTQIDLPDGRRFRFAQNGAAALAAARLVQSVVPVANHLNIPVQAAAAAGATQISVTLGATAVAANAYRDGYVYVNDAGADTTTEGYMYRIKSHPAASGAATLTLTLYEDSPVKVALTTNSEVTLIRNKFSGVIIHPSPPTSLVVGATPVAVDANAYFWCQTRGLCPVLTDGTLVQARSAMPSASVDGAVSPLTFTEGTPNVEIAYVVGRVAAVNATTEESLIYLELE